MIRAKEGDTVTVEYVGTIDSGELFETTEETGPLDFQLGRNEVLPAFEQAILGMAVAESKTITLPPGEAYGERLPELVHTIDSRLLADKNDPQPGMVIAMNVEHQGKSQKVPALVTAVMGDRVTVDFNHPLAGKELTYTITLQGILPASEEAGIP